MAIKIGIKQVGENPEEQRQLEKKRFEAKRKRMEEDNEEKEFKLLKMGEGIGSFLIFLKRNDLRI